MELVTQKEKHCNILQCIINNNLHELNNLLKDNSINEVYPCREWNDYITPLIASIVNQKEDICTFLLKEGADPNKESQNGLTPLHYVSLSKAHHVFAEKLIEAKANPNGWDLIPRKSLTPLQTAAIQHRDDVVKELIYAGAQVTRLPVTDPEHITPNEKVYQIIQNLASKGDKLCSNIIYFLDLDIAVQGGPPEEVLKTFAGHMLLEDPQSHLTMIETLFNPTWPDKEKYRLGSIKWLKDTGNLNYYIVGAVNRFPNIPQKHLHWAIFTLHAVFCTMDDIPKEQTLPIIPQLLEQLCSEERPDICEVILQTLYVITQKTKGLNDWDTNFIQELCKKVAPFVKEEYSIHIRVFAYSIFANFLLVEQAANFFTSVGITSVPVDVLMSADKEVLGRLKKHFDKPNLECEDIQALTISENRSDTQQSPSDTAGAPVEKSTPPGNVIPIQPSTLKNQQKWFSNSTRWKKQLEKILSTDESEVTRIGGLMYVQKDEFRIAKGSNGTEVFLGLRKDGTEVAIKKMLKCNDKVLENEEIILRHRKLYDAYIVRYVDLEEDKNFAYLGLQLCEYDLEEYIGRFFPVVSLTVSKCLVYEVLESLKVLHCLSPSILHRDLKPKNVLIDVNGRARLADFGIGRQLPEGQTTFYTGNAGTKCWKARETLEVKAYTPYKWSTDIQVAGMLVYYILSGGHHPFGDQTFECEHNIHNGSYTLDDVKDVVAKDLIECMIDKEPTNRPNAEECLSHPFFWTTDRTEYLKRIGNRTEAKRCHDADEELISSLEKCALDGSLKQWKNKFPSDLVKKMDKHNKAYPDHVLGLLRFIRNLHEHYPEEAPNCDLMSMFPDLFGSVYIFAKSRGWNLAPPLKDMFQTVLPKVLKPPTNVEHLNLPVQDSHPPMTKPIVNGHQARRSSI